MTTLTLTAWDGTGRSGERSSSHSFDDNPDSASTSDPSAGTQDLERRHILGRKKKGRETRKRKKYAARDAISGARFLLLRDRRDKGGGFISLHSRVVAFLSVVFRAYLRH